MKLAKKSMFACFPVTLVCCLLYFFAGGSTGRTINNTQPANDWIFTPYDVPDSIATRLWFINSTGDTLVGHYQDPELVIHGFVQHSDGSIQTLDVPFPDATGTQTVARSINGQGCVVGRYLTADGTERGWLFDSNSYTRIEVPGSTETYAHGINDAGVIVGSYLSGGQRHGYLLKGDGFTPFDVPDSVLTNITGITNDGDIFGNFDGLDNAHHGFVQYSDGSIQTIDFPGATLTGVGGINSAGSIVGLMQTPDGVSHGFLFENGEFTQIDFPDPNTVATQTTGIADTNEIVGFYFLNDSPRPHGFRLVGRGSETDGNFR